MWDDIDSCRVSALASRDPGLATAAATAATAATAAAGAAAVSIAVDDRSWSRSLRTSN